MTISTRQYEAMGARIYAPEGPFGPMNNFPGPTFRFGDVVDGDAESEFVYLNYCPTTTVTFNQGDVFMWDGAYLAFPAFSANTAQYEIEFGVNAGTLFLGGRLGDPAADVTGNIWSYQFLAGGSYGIWVQRAGTTALHLSVFTNSHSIPSTTTTAGAIAQPTGATHYSTFTSGSIGAFATSVAYTATASSGSTQLNTLVPALGVAVNRVQRGDYASGTSVPNGAYVTDINGTTGVITLSAAVTANISAGTVTFTRGTLWGTIPVAAASGPSQIFCANIPAGVYPNCTISGTGLSSTTITSITGTPGNYIVTVAGASSQELTLEQFTITGYYEGYVRWPYVSAST